MSLPPRLRPVGEAALSVEFGARLDPALWRRVRALDLALRERAPAWLREAVPSYRALLAVFDPSAVDAEEAGRTLLELAARAPASVPPGARHEIPARYGGEDGPDLPAVARRCALTEGEVVARHAAGEYTAFLLGFMPGFAYLGLLPPELETPRLSTPRLRVPAGSVAVAGRQTAVYPVASPGGWNLIARTSLSLFDPAADPPARIQPGDRVRFVAVDELPEPAAPAPAPAAPASPAFEVASPGLLTTVQDLGRRGWRRSGVGWAGAVDAPALRAANRALGNDAAAAGLECTLQGPTLRFLRSVRFAVAGAELGAVLERADLGAWPVPRGVAVLARAGNLLRFTGAHAGCRAYVAFAGGLDVPLLLGSRSTDLAGGLGRALQAGDRLGLRPASAETSSDAGASRAAEAPCPAGEVEVRVVLGPQEEAFGEESRQAFLGEAYTVRSESDRVGWRLQGPALAHAGEAEIVSDAMLPGSVQVPPDGQPIVMGPDGPTTGGYPKIATVIGADLARLGQMRPGQRVRFRAVTPEQARLAREEP